MNILQALIISLFFVSFVKNEDPTGNYEYRSREYYYHESIRLNSNHSFVYNCDMPFTKFEIKGSYSIFNDTLMLNSIPQRDKLIVKESYKTRKKDNRIFVTDKHGYLLTYHLYLIKENEEIQILRDQWNSTDISGLDFKGFYLVDTKSLQSPIYIKQGKFSNHFEVQFETIRVFENESWIIKNEKITPRGLDGKFQNYFLTKSL